MTFPKSCEKPISKAHYTYYPTGCCCGFASSRRRERGSGSACRPAVIAGCRGQRVGNEAVSFRLQHPHQQAVAQPELVPERRQHMQDDQHDEDGLAELVQATERGDEPIGENAGHRHGDEQSIERDVGQPRQQGEDGRAFGQGRRTVGQTQHDADGDSGENREADPDMQRRLCRDTRVDHLAAPDRAQAVRHRIAEDELEEDERHDQPVQGDLAGRIASRNRVLHRMPRGSHLRLE